MPFKDSLGAGLGRRPLESPQAAAQGPANPVVQADQAPATRTPSLPAAVEASSSSHALTFQAGPLIEVGFWADPRDEYDERPDPAKLVDQDWAKTSAALAVALYARSGYVESYEFGYSFCRLGCRGRAGSFLSGRDSTGSGGALTRAAAAGAGAAAAADPCRSAIKSSDRGSKSGRGGTECNKFMGCTTLTDGRYVWPEGLAHYVSEHALRPPEDFVRHALGNLRALRKAQASGRLRWDVDDRGEGRTAPLDPGTAAFLRDKTTLGIALPPDTEIRKSSDRGLRSCVAS